MKPFLGNYLGLCINNDDPERRGRVQIFIPHIMPALFKDWNETGKDVQLLCVGNNLPQSLPSYMIEKLKKMLPWAECASPILGTSSPGQLAGNNFDQSPVVGGAGSVAPLGGEGLPPNVGLESGDVAPKPELASLLGQAATAVYGQGATVEIFSGTAARAAGTDRHPGGWAADVTFRDPQGNLITGDRLAGVVKFWHDNQLGSTGINGDGAMRTGALHMDLVGGRFGRPLQGGEALWWSYSGGLSPAMTAAVSNVAPGKQSYRGLVTPSTIPGASTLSLASQSHEYTSLGSGGPASYNPQQDPNPFKLGSGAGSDTWVNPFAQFQTRGGTSAPPTGPTAAGQTTVAAGGGGLLVDQSGRVGSAQLRSELLRLIQSNPSSIYNSGKIPVNGEKYGINGTPESWANFYAKLAGFESSYDATAPIKDFAIPGVREPGGSGGLFQLGRSQVKIWADKYPQIAQRYGIQPGVAYPPEAVLDPNFASRGMLLIGESLLTEHFVMENGIFGDKPGAQGIGRTIGSYSWNKIASGVDPGTGATDPTMTPLAASAMVMTTDTKGTTQVLDINNMAKGVFTYPAAGAMLWVFFREGNPLFPVYFAANYGQREWESAFGRGSDAPGYKPAVNDSNNIISTGTVINWGVGGIRVENTTDPTTPTNNQKSVMFFGHDGSNMFINDGYHQLYSRFDRRDQVDGSRFQSTLGTKEEIVQSDSNSIIMGDRIIKIGNVSPDAVNAMNEIHDIIKEIMQPITQTAGFQPKSPPSAPTRRGEKYIKKAIDQANANYFVPPGPYNIPAQEFLKQARGQVQEEPKPPKVAEFNEVPITPPTPPIS
jgi:hypothetical protein